MLIYIVEVVSVARVAARHELNKERYLAWTHSRVVTGVKVSIVLVVEVALVLLDCWLLFAYMVLLMAIAPWTRLDAINLQAW